MSTRRTAKPRQESDTHWHPGDVLLAAVGFGFLAGMVEAAAAAIRFRIMHVTVFMGPELVWQLPLADGIIFLVIGIVLVLVGTVWRRLRTPRLVIAVFSGLVLFSALLLTEKIHFAAEAILAAGMGLAIARTLAPRSDRLRRGLRFAVPAGVVTVAGLAIGQRALRQASEHRALAALPALPAGQLNILLLVLDTVRAWNLGLYGYGRPTTPKLGSWATYGAQFDRAFAPAPWTTPAHAVMFTGRYPTELSVSWRTPLDATYPTLAERLHAAGYATAGFGGNYMNVGRGTGLDRGFLHYEDYPFQPVQLFRSTSMLGRLLQIDRLKAMVGRRRMVPGWVGSEVNQRFLRWLDSRGTHPWFAFLNYFDAHGPYLPPVPYDTIYMGKPDPPVDRYWDNLRRAYGPPPVPIQQLAEELDAYDGGITYLDLQVDAVLRALADRGQLGNTVVVVTSDHGELFGEHGVLSHGNSLYLPALHVPLLLIAPGRVPAGVRVSSLASLRDLPATLLELVGVPRSGVPGNSLLALWRGGGPLALTDTLVATLDYNWLIPKWPLSPVLRGPMRTVVLDSLQYILNGDGLEELYHLGNDAWQIRNLVSAPEYQADLARYRGALRALPGAPWSPGAVRRAPVSR